ncbi:hypothetical protein SE18_22215 [Herpetosiphon geysericola]|uniref:Uncharacterized protein n=1 Tax=Herpetosiphon geysericola TaxID=70996 RepID=A0A0N8GPN2_9CHLR|nr:hypothetical protein SE18_22215 [Herpetosiphon geysericola]
MGELAIGFGLSEIRLENQKPIANSLQQIAITQLAPNEWQIAALLAVGGVADTQGSSLIIGLNEQSILVR